ncbi:hypothetical protein JCM14036_30680 [Desulfotomaculum defluvii]
MSSAGKIDYLDYTVKRIKVVTDLIIHLITPENIRIKNKYQQEFDAIWKSCGICNGESVPELIEFTETKTEKIFYFKLPYGLIPDDFRKTDKEKRMAWAIRAKEVKIEEDNHKHLLIVNVQY